MMTASLVTLRKVSPYPIISPWFPATDHRLVTLFHQMPCGSNPSPGMGGTNPGTSNVPPALGGSALEVTISTEPRHVYVQPCQL